MKTDKFPSELDRLERLLKWWGAPAQSGTDFRQSQLHRFEAIVSELEKAVGEIAHNQEEALTQSRELLIQSLPTFVQSQDLNEVMAVQSKILTALMDSASTQVKTWMSFAERIRNAQLSLVTETDETVSDAEETGTSVAASRQA